VDELPPVRDETGLVVLGSPGTPTRFVEAPLTAEEVATRRRNRWRLLMIVVPGAILIGITLVAVILAGSTPAPVKPVSLPPGYSSSTDGYFAFAFPSGWSTNDLYSDNTGDNDLSGPSGWVAEHIGVRSVPPVVGETPPKSLQAFGMDQPSAFELSAGTPVEVPGAVALRYTMTRPGGFKAVVIDAWRPTVGAEIWLVVEADPATTGTIIRSLNT
jgi:hypothetical protein